MEIHCYNTRTAHLLILICSLYCVHCEDLPKIILNGTRSIIFPGDQLDRFFQCLCESKSLTCTVQYNKNGNLYDVKNTSQTDSASSGMIFGTSQSQKSYLCNTTMLHLNSANEFTCSRLQGTFFCYDGLTVCRSCEAGDVVIFWNFATHVAVQNMDSTISNFSTTTIPKVDEKVLNEPSTSKEDETMWHVITAALSCLVLILLVTVIIFIIIFCKRRNSKIPENSDEPVNVVSPGTGNQAVEFDSAYEDCETDSGHHGDTKYRSNSTVNPRDTANDPELRFSYVNGVETRSTSTPESVIPTCPTRNETNPSCDDSNLAIDYLDVIPVTYSSDYDLIDDDIVASRENETGNTSGSEHIDPLVVETSEDSKIGQNS